MKKNNLITKQNAKKAIEQANNLITKQNAKKVIEQANDGAKFLAENKHFLVFLGVGIGGFMIYKGVKKLLFNTGEGLKKVFESKPDDFIRTKPNVNKENTTISEEKAKQLAKALQEASNDGGGLFDTTNEDKIENVFRQIKTADDYKMVYNAFGLRLYLNGSTPTNFIDKEFATARDLNFWLKKELSSFWDRTLYNIVKERVKSAGFEF